MTRSSNRRPGAVIEGDTLVFMGLFGTAAKTQSWGTPVVIFYVPAPCFVWPNRVIRPALYYRFDIIWLAPWQCKINRILSCDWLLWRAVLRHLSRSGLPAVSRVKRVFFVSCNKFSVNQVKFVWSRWLDIGLVLFQQGYGRQLPPSP